MANLYTANYITHLPVNLDNFFGGAHPCYDYSIYKDAEGQLTLKVEDFGVNTSVYTIEEVASTIHGDIYHSHNYYYFLEIQDEDSRCILIKSV